MDKMIDRLQPALRGYPVRELIELWVETENLDGAAASRLVEFCMSRWIVRLDAPADALSNDMPDELLTRQQCARHALELVKNRFRRSAVIHTAR